MHSATEAVGTSFKKLGASLSSLTGRRSSMRRNGSDEGSGGAERTPQFVQTDDVSYDAPPTAAAAGGAAPPPAGVAPPPAPAPSPLGDGAHGSGGLRNPSAGLWLAASFLNKTNWAGLRLLPGFAVLSMRTAVARACAST